MPPDTLPAFSLLAPPYETLLPLDDREEFPPHPRAFRGAALVWNLARGDTEDHLDVAAQRPGGLPLLVLLPPAPAILRLRARMLEVVEETHPKGMLPHHPSPDASELRHLLRQGPSSFPGEAVDFLWWRGLRPDQETRQLIGRIAELSAELQTLAAVARGVYLSRRALGRRFHVRGLPAPSRWLQFFRLMRAGVLLQNTDRSLCEVARSLGYPDGFTLSNQMERMIGVRPSLVRERLGWEWIMESWLRMEWECGGLAKRLRGFEHAASHPDRGPDPHDAPADARNGAERSDEAA
jgi:AraC-like DNA-binding protein